MKDPVFTGSGTALVTPMNSDGSINYGGLQELVENQIANGTNALIICGTTGEASTLEHDEHVECIRVCVKTADGRVPVVAGTGSNHTDYAVELSKEAEGVGADALLMVSPYYNKTTQNGLVKHFTFVADRVGIPIILYNVPSRTGMSFTADTYEKLSSHEMINGVKEASGNMVLVAETRYRCGDSLNIWSGNDQEIVPIMAMGGRGVISVASNIAPRVVSDLCAKALAGDFAGAAKMQADYFDLLNDMFLEVNPMPIKAAMNMAGMNAGPARLPLCEVTDATAAALEKALRRHGLMQ